jgi:hypothetical protein
VGTQNGGVFRFAADGQSHRVPGLSHDTALSLGEDREGNLWVGTRAGLQRLSPRRVTRLIDLPIPRALETSPDGSVWVRTHPLTCLHDHMTPTHFHEWDQLTYAASGVMRVHTDTASWVVPPHRAVWVPAGIRHHEEMHAPVSVRT